jgi:hypothetical protein
MEVSGQLHASNALPLEKGPRYPLDRKLVGPQSRSGLQEGKKHFLLLAGIERWFLGLPSRNPVAIATELEIMKW